MLYKMYLDPNTVYEEGDFFDAVPTIGSGGPTSTPPIGTPTPSTTPAPSATPRPTGVQTDAAGNVIDYGSDAAGVNRTLSVTEITKLVTLGVLSWAEGEQILLNQAQGVYLPPATVAKYKVAVAQAEPAASTNVVTPDIRGFDLTPTTSDKETARTILDQKSGRLDLVMPDGSIVNVTPGRIVGGEGDPYAGQTADRYFMIETPGRIQVWDNVQKRMMDFTDEAASKSGVPNIGGLVGLGGAAAADPYAGMSPQEKEAAMYDAAVAEANNAMQQYVNALPPGTRFFQTGTGEGFYYDAQGRKVPIGYVGSRGRVEAGQPASGVNFVTGPGGFTAVTNPGRSRAIEDAFRASGQTALTPEQSAIVSALGPVHGAAYVKEVLGLDYNPTLSDLTALKGAGSVGAMGSPKVRWAIQQDPDELERIVGGTSTDPEFEARTRAWAERAYPGDPQKQEAWIKSRIAGRRLTEAFQKVLNPDPIAGIAGDQLNYLTGQGYTFDEGSNKFVSSNVKSWNTETGEWEAQTLDPKEAYRQAQDATFDPASLMQTYSNALEQAKGRGYGIQPSNNGWTITLPDGTTHGGFGTREEAEAYLARYFLAQEERMRAALANENQTLLSTLNETPTRLRVNPSSLTAPLQMDSGESVVHRPPPRGPVLPDLPPPVDTAPPTVPPIPENPYLPIYAFDEGGRVAQRPDMRRAGMPMIFNPNVQLDPSQVIDRRPSLSGAGAMYRIMTHPWLKLFLGDMFGFENGGAVNTMGDVGTPGAQPHLMLDEPAVLTGLKTGRPYAVAAEAGNKEVVSQAPDGGLNFTPTDLPMSGDTGMQMPADPIEEAKKANDWQQVARLTGKPLSDVLREAARERARPKLRA